MSGGCHDTQSCPTAPAQRAVMFTGGAMRPAENMPGCLPSCSSPVWAMPAPAGRHMEILPQGCLCAQHAGFSVLPAPMAGRRSGDPDLGTVQLSWGIAQSEGLTHCLHTELPPVLCVVCGGIQDAEVELGEEPHVLAGEDADMSLPASPVVPRGDPARCGHIPEEQRVGSCSTSCLLPQAKLEGRECVTSSFPVPPSTAGHHPYGTEGQPRP